MTLEMAIRETLAGRVGRIAVPGKWKVWREDGTFRVEILGACRRVELAAAASS